MRVHGPEIVAIVCNCGVSDFPLNVPDGYVADLDGTTTPCTERVHRVPSVRLSIDPLRMRPPLHTDEAN